MRLYVTVWNSIQIALNLGSFFTFITLFSITGGQKSALMNLFADLACMRCCGFGIILNCYSQTIYPSQRRQTDINIFLFGVFFLLTIIIAGWVFYWLVIISPSIIIQWARIVKGMGVLILMLNFSIMVVFVLTTIVTLNYIAGYPNGWG